MSSTDLAIAGASLADRIAYAEALSHASLLPAQFRGKPADVLLAIEWGAGLGLAPMAAINSIHVIDGKPGLSAIALAKLVRDGGHRMRVTGDDKSATASIWRKDDPDFEYRVTWTIEMAKRAGLVNDKKPNWVKYPGAMLKARAQTSVVKDACPELILGMPAADDTDGPDWHTPPTVTVARDDAPPPGVDPATGEIVADAPAPAAPGIVAIDLDAAAAEIATANLDTLRALWQAWHTSPDWPEIEPLIAERRAQLSATPPAEDPA